MAELSKGIRKFVMIVSDKNFPKNPMQFRPNQEVEAKQQEKTNSAIFPRDETVLEFPTKPESVKRKEYCRNCYLNVLAKSKVKISTNQEVEAEKQKHFKDQITMKAGFIFPKPVPSTNYRH
jgi:hypothetical protein